MTFHNDNSNYKSKHLDDKPPIGRGKISLTSSEHVIDSKINRQYEQTFDINQSQFPNILRKFSISSSISSQTNQSVKTNKSLKQNYPPNSLNRYKSSNYQTSNFKRKPSTVSHSSGHSKTSRSSSISTFLFSFPSKRSKNSNPSSQTTLESGQENTYCSFETISSSFGDIINYTNKISDRFRGQRESERRDRVKDFCSNWSNCKTKNNEIIRDFSNSTLDTEISATSFSTNNKPSDEISVTSQQTSSKTELQTIQENPVVKQVSEMSTINYARKNGFIPPLDLHQILAWATLLTAIISNYIFILPGFRKTQKVALTVVFSILSLLTFILMLATTLINSADKNVNFSKNRFLPEFKKSKERPNVISNTTHFCYVCNVNVHPSSKHCRICNKCISNFDHHCRYLNTCIGAKNYKYFMTILISVMILTSFSITVNLYILISTFTEKQKFSNSLNKNTSTINPNLWWFNKPAWIAVSIYLCLITLIQIIVFFSVLHLFIFHLYLINKKQSTYNYILEKRKQKSQPKQTGRTNNLTNHPNQIKKAPKSDYSGFTNVSTTENSQCFNICFRNFGPFKVSSGKFFGKSNSVAPVPETVGVNSVGDVNLIYDDEFDGTNKGRIDVSRGNLKRRASVSGKTKMEIPSLSKFNHSKPPEMYSDAIERMTQSMTISTDYKHAYANKNFNNNNSLSRQSSESSIHKDYISFEGDHNDNHTPDVVKNLKFNVNKYRASSNVAKGKCPNIEMNNIKKLTPVPPNIQIQKSANQDE